MAPPCCAHPHRQSVPGPHHEVASPCIHHYPGHFSPLEVSRSPCCPSPLPPFSSFIKQGTCPSPAQSRRPLDGELLRAWCPPSRPQSLPPVDHQQSLTVPKLTRHFTPGLCTASLPPPASCLPGHFYFDLRVVCGRAEVWVTQQHGTAIFKMGSPTWTYCKA